MDTVATIAGHDIQFAQVYLFVTQWFLPSVWGVAGSVLTEFMKKAGIVDASGTARRWVLRAVVAAVCVALNLAGALLVHETVGVGVLLQSFWSYLFAVATYEHAR